MSACSAPFCSPATLSSPTRSTTPASSMAFVFRGARKIIYPHGDLQFPRTRLARKCQRAAARSSSSPKAFSAWRVTSPLSPISCARKRSWRRINLDEAHAIGVSGIEGRGIVGGPAWIAATFLPPCTLRQSPGHLRRFCVLQLCGQRLSRQSRAQFHFQHGDAALHRASNSRRAYLRHALRIRPPRPSSPTRLLPFAPRSPPRP